MKKYTYLILLAILLGGFVFRLYHFSSPIADWHSWRQADTSAVSRNFVKTGFNILHPKFDDLSNVPSGVNNPMGYRFVEFPIYNVAQAGLFKVMGVFTLEQWGRLVTIFSSTITSVLIFLILRRHQSDVAGLAGAFFFSFLPFSVFYGRAVLPDTTTSAAMLAAVYFFDLWIEKKNNKTFFVLSSVFLMAAILLKPFSLFFTLPMVYLAVKSFGKSFYRQKSLWLMAAISLLPFALWRIWMVQYPEGIPFNGWLFNDGNLRFKGAFFYWVFGERLGKLILGYWGAGLLLMGMISRVRKDALFMYSFLISALLYVTVVARGNVQHDYYQILILPSICLFLGLGADYLIRGYRQFAYRAVGPALFLVFTFFTLFFSWYFVRDHYNINTPAIVTAGQAVDRLTPKDAKVIANYEGDTTFLYQTNRQGWASFQHGADEMKKLGATHLALVHPRPSDFEYAKGHKIIEQTSEYVIFDLREAE